MHWSSQVKKKNRNHFGIKVICRLSSSIRNRIMKPLLIIGPIVHSIVKDNIIIEDNAAIAVKDGKILGLENSKDLSKLESLTGKDYLLIQLKPGQFLCPGFIDLHIHACQYPNQGLGYDLPLLEWLHKYTIPLETKYKNNEFANSVYKYVVDTTLSCGTTTACYYATIYKDSSLQLASIIAEKGQRALVGKVNMNQNSIDSYVETTEKSIGDTKEFIESVTKMTNKLVEPAITPRFAISCNMELLNELSKLAKQHDLYIQTHISENKTEVDLTKSLFNSCACYADVYDKAGLLTNKTILGHGIFLEDSECELLSSRGVAIAHCPNSNTVLRSGMCDVKKLWKHGVKVGLGTDVAGGCSPSIIDAMRCALTTSMHISFSNNINPLNFHEVFYLATLGGAEALGKEKIIGNFTKGKEFDALIIDMDLGKSVTGSLEEHTTLELVQKFIYSGDDRNVKQVFVNGRVVKLK